MIKSKKELAYYLECDRLALGQKKKRPSFFGDEIWKFQIYMRKLDFCRCAGGVYALIGKYYGLRYHYLSIKLGFSIPCDITGPGLSLAHYGTLIISTKSRIGKDCRIHAGVNIGANAGEAEAATIGDGVYIGPGAKLIGAVKIGNGAVIGANAVVTHDVPENVTVAGVPAKVISNNDSSRHLIRATEIVDEENQNEKNNDRIRDKTGGN